MIKVGLTGGIGSGKSTVTAFLKERLIPVIDADIVSREVLKIYPELLNKLKEEFGEKYFDEVGNLKRRELGNFVFVHQLERVKLEEIILPYIKKEINKRLENYRSLKVNICVVDAPTLIETGLDEEMDVNILVYVDEATQIYRVMKRDNMKEVAVKDRIKAQIPLEEKKKHVDFVIDNSGTTDNTERQLEKVLSSIEII
jgi:dephospho-CoA kinase